MAPWARLVVVALLAILARSTLTGCGSGPSGDTLRVVTLGDSVAYDADPGIRAALEATGHVEVDTRSFGGVGLLRPGFDDYLADALAAEPHVVTLMAGGWDFGEAMEDPDAYRSRLRAVATEIGGSGAFLVWLGLPPTPPGEGIEQHRLLVNDLVASVVAGLDRARYVDTGPLLGDDDGAFTRERPGPDGSLQQVRKVRGGRDDGHLCPAGAALVGLGVAAVLGAADVVGEPSGEWWTGEWTSDARYDDPPGGCAG